MKPLTSYLRRLTHSPAVQFFSARKRFFSIVILAISFVVFGYYITSHPDVLNEVVKVGFVKSIVLLLLYFCVLLAYFGVTYATILLCRKHLPIKEGFLLTIYSSVINFIGPLQSGPAVRAVYLKTKLGLRIRDYTYAMLFYYFAFAAINASLLVVNGWAWLSALGIIAGIGLTIIATYKLKFGVLGKYVIYIFLLTLLQIIFMVMIYTIELRTVNPDAHYSLLQTTSYTASANLSLFVSLTPGGIGIREAFLVFSQSLHHVQVSSIVAAGILDRAIYIIFLLILFAVSSGLHLKQSFVGKH